MKNLHLIATDKPSRLFIIDKSKMFLSEPPHLSFSTVGGKVHKIEGSELYQPQNLYITSDEEIKEGDWFLDFRFPSMMIPRQQRDGIYDHVVNACRKIILTTDQDLIKDGVQNINDEFLEWFVKNPSCEEVEVIEQKLNTDYRSDWKEKFYYKIITPKKEPKQFCDNCKREISKWGCACGKQEEPNPFELQKTLPDDVFYESLEPKQETLEEAAERYKNLKLPDDLYDGFITGAQWQQEQDKKCYHPMTERKHTSDIHFECTICGYSNY